MLSHSFTVGPYEGMQTSFTLTGVEVCKTTPGVGRLTLRGWYCTPALRAVGSHEALTTTSWELKSTYLKDSNVSSSSRSVFVDSSAAVPFDLSLQSSETGGPVEFGINGKQWYGGPTFYDLTVLGRFAWPGTTSSTWCQ